MNTAKGGEGVTEQEQAASLTEAYGLLKSSYVPSVKRLYWYTWSDGWTGGPGHDDNGTLPEWKYGIVTPNSGPFPKPSDWIKKPAFQAMKAQ